MRSLSEALGRVVVLVAGLQGAGCMAFTPVKGANNVLVFAVDSPDVPLLAPRADTAIAQDTKLTYTIRGPNGEEASILSARISPDGIVRLVETSTGRVVLVAEQPGSAVLTVETDAGVDGLSIDVTPIASASVDHWSQIFGQLFVARAARGAPEPPRVVFIVGGTGRFLVGTKGDRGQDLLGFGTRAPITVEPAGAATVKEAIPGELSHIEVSFAEPGVVELEPANGARRRFDIVRPEEITEMEIVSCTLSECLKRLSMVVGAHALVAVRGRGPSLEHAPLVMGDVVELSVTTPATCGLQTEDVRRSWGDGVAQLVGFSPGPCRVEARLGDLTSETTIEIVSRQPPAGG